MQTRIVRDSELLERQLPLLEKAEKNVLIRGSVVDSPTQGLTIIFELGAIFAIEQVPRFIGCELITHKSVGEWWFLNKPEVSDDPPGSISKMLADWNRMGTGYCDGRTVLVRSGNTQYQELPRRVGYLHPQFMQQVVAIRYELLNYIAQSSDALVTEGCQVLTNRLEGVIRDQWRHLPDSGVIPYFD